MTDFIHCHSFRGDGFLATSAKSFDLFLTITTPCRHPGGSRYSAPKLPIKAHLFEKYCNIASKQRVSSFWIN